MKVLLALALLLAGATTAADFRAAVVKVDITPTTSQWLLGYGARQSKGVHDNIYHRVVILDDGKKQFALVSSDLCLVSPAEYEKVAKMVEQKTGIDRLHFWWTFTHTHSAPEVGPPGLAVAFLGDRYTHAVDNTYTDFAENALVDAIAKAKTQLKPAKLGVAWGVAYANINRRARDIEGETFLGLNPDGPSDKRLGLIRIDARDDGKPIALLANYPIHGTVLGGQNLLISGDAPGIVSEYVEQKIGAPLLFLNGAAGDQAPIYSTQPDFRAGRIGQFRVLLGNRILETNQKLQTTTTAINIAASEANVDTPRRPGLTFPEPLAQYAPGSSVRLPVRFLKLNKQIAIWSAPIELFCEVAMDVRDKSAFANTFYSGYTNGWLGYMLTPKELPFGGYEPRVSPYTAQGAADLTKAVLRELGAKGR